MTTGYLLDTHVLLWAALEPVRLGDEITRLVDDADERVLVSAVTIAELVIKQAIGKLTLHGPADELPVPYGFEMIDLTERHAQRMAELPLLHRDPFDRLLLAQALAEDLTLITADQEMLRYRDVSLLPVPI